MRRFSRFWLSLSYCIIAATLFVYLYASKKQPGNQTKVKLYIITATYPRMVQVAELTRLCITLKQIVHVHWIVCEDNLVRSNSTAELLGNCGVPYTHLNIPTPSSQKQRPYGPRWLHPRGVAQRNSGLEWLRDALAHGQEPGVLYIADDDNTYSLEVFEEMRSTKRASTWPVAFVGEMPWEGCVTSPTDRSKITSMWAGYRPERPFPIDMAGFAIHTDLLRAHPNAQFHHDWPVGMQESLFLQSLGLKDWHDLEPKANGCQKILVWHTRTKDPELQIWHRLQAQGVIVPPLADSIT